MTDVAAEAGISRKTLYRIFDGRKALVDQVLLKLFGDMKERILNRLHPIKDLKASIIDGLLISAEVAQQDQLFNEIIRTETDYDADKLLVFGNDATNAYMLELWGPILDRAREQGLIRPTLTNDKIFQLMMSFIAIMMMRGGVKAEEERVFLTDMLAAIFSE